MNNLSRVAQKSILFCFMLVFLMPIGGFAHDSFSHEPDRSITVLELKNALKSEDINRIVFALNQVKRNQESHDLMLFVAQLWSGKHTEETNLPWHIINSPRIRIEIANILVQASNNGLIKINRNEVHSFARGVISAQSEGEVTALLTLGLFNDPEDIDLLKSVALTENQHTFRAAILALAKICHPKGEVALVQIRKLVKQDSNARFVQVPTSELAPYRRCDTPKKK